MNAELTEQRTALIATVERFAKTEIAPNVKVDDATAHSPPARTASRRPLLAQGSCFGVGASVVRSTRPRAQCAFQT